MNAYYIYLEGNQQGPFSARELQDRGIGPDTLVWYEGAPEWLPAGAVPELSEALHMGPVTSSPEVQIPGQQHPIPKLSGPAPKAALRPSRKAQAAAAYQRIRALARTNTRVFMVLAILVGLTIGICGYLLLRRQSVSSTGGKSARIREIHEREVRKAMEELRADKSRRRRESKKREEERKEALRKCSAELRSLQAQLSSSLSRRRYALGELEDIRRPRLFRSRSKKEREEAAQLRYIRSLDGQARSLRARIEKCRRDQIRLSTPDSSGSPS